ncbi:MAG: PKD domain-containing protein, partial [Bacteroidales bacterium]|nr:PKD domain-containing protein [Bacteroidales bacterium]
TIKTSIDLLETIGVEQIETYPNPFNKEVSINFYSNFHERAHILVYNVNGEKIAEWVNYVEIGMNILNLKSGVEGILLISIRSENIQLNAKIICLEKSVISEISSVAPLTHSISVKKIKSSFASNTEFIYRLGDQLRYTGYSGESISEDIIDTPSGDTSYIFVFDVASRLPKADFDVSSNIIDQGTSISFIDISSNTPSNWLWDFGDGDTSNVQNPSHVYLSPGTYTITLTCWNDYGSDTLKKEDYIRVNSLVPIAEFSANVRTIIPGGEINFFDESTNSPSSWLWEFGDGDTSQYQNPTHIYVAAGLYSIKLIVNNQYGSDTISISDYIEVQEEPDPLLFISPTNLEFDSIFTQKTLYIKNEGTGVLNWTISEDTDWLYVSPQSGETTTETDLITVSINRSGLSPGNYSGSIIINSDGGNSNLNVSMLVKEEVISSETPKEPNWK